MVQEEFTTSQLVEMIGALHNTNRISRMILPACVMAKQQTYRMLGDMPPPETKARDTRDFRS